MAKERTHLWRGKDVTERQFEHYVRMTNVPPSNSGPKSYLAVMERFEDEFECGPPGDLCIPDRNTGGTMYCEKHYDELFPEDG